MRKKGGREGGGETGGEGGVERVEGREIGGGRGERGRE